MILGGNTDFGDAPDPTYPTLLANDGARHEFRVGFFLGAGVDSEQDGEPSPGASADLDDGVTFNGDVRTGFDASVTVDASADGLLDAWIDFNGDGDWDDAGEQIFANTSLSAGVNTLQFNVPSSMVGNETYARFRFSSAAARRVPETSPS